MEINTLIYTLNEFIVIYRKLLHDYTHYYKRVIFHSNHG